MIDLKEIAKENGYKYTTKGGEKDDMFFGQPEYKQGRIPCEHGAIFLGREGTLGSDLILRAFSDRPQIIKTMAVLEGVTHTHTRWEENGAVSELTIGFSESLLPQVAKVLKPRKRRVATPEAIARLEKYRHRPAPSSDFEGAFAPGEDDTDGQYDSTSEDPNA